jgi:hypothetical protein
MPTYVATGYLTAVICHHFFAFVHQLISLFMAKPLRVPHRVVAMIFLDGTEAIAQTLFFLFVRHISW